MRVPAEAFDAFVGGADPAVSSRVAHDTAAALLHRIRGGSDPAAVERLVAYTDDRGIDEFAELWSKAAAHSLPGALWRLYVIRAAVRHDADGAAYLFELGVQDDASVNPAIAGAPTPSGPRELELLIDEILRGAFVGDFELALERAAAFCRIMSRGALETASRQERSEVVDWDAWCSASGVAGERDTLRAARYLEYADDLHHAARRWARGELD
ncbi:DNA-directed RNA polymerase subunit beta [Pseudoclavibacter alba]|nr:DNA-directed RNA polymerase subunit beta [Pseudoclavibacter alba]MBN6777322.1 DNA-directed RNA polymerase subunit beta [Pseudoclavibacter alba]